MAERNEHGLTLDQMDMLAVLRLKEFSAKRWWRITQTAAAYVVEVTDVRGKRHRGEATTISGAVINAIIEAGIPK